MVELIGLIAVIAVCLALEGILSIANDVCWDDEPRQTFTDCMDDVTESIGRDVKRIRRRQ